MTGSSPVDLAVAFRSFARRASEVRASATGPLEGRAAMERELTALTSIIAGAAQRLGVAADGAAIATKIESIAPSQWDDANLEALRSAALEAGGALRRAAEAATG